MLVLRPLLLLAITFCLSRPVAATETPFPLGVAQDFDKSPADFCDATELDTVLANDFHRAAQEVPIEASDRAQLLDVYLERVYRGGGGYPSWDLSLMPTLYARSLPLKQIWTDRFAIRVDLKEALAELDRPDRSFEGDPDSAGSAHSFGIIAAPVDVAMPFACSEFFGLWKAGTCNPVFKFLISLAAGDNTIGNTGYAIWNKVLRDSSYDRGVIEAAKIVAARLEEPDLRNADLYNDVLSGFQRAGLSLSDAIEHTWNALGLMATSGANLDLRIPSQASTSRHKILALILMADALPLLDHKSAHAGRVYSFPKKVKVRCNSGKSYHFWYSAYLARQAVLHGFETEVSAVATFQLAKAYQIFGFEGQRTGEIKGSEALTPPYLILRVDFAYAATGAQYGALSGIGREPKLDVDNLISRLIRTTNQGPRSLSLAATAGSGLSADLGQSLKRYQSFMSVLNPNAAITLPFAPEPEAALSDGFRHRPH